jgi:anti-sigma28 factor (negative regulator of flagellin synthesis)
MPTPQERIDAANEKIRNGSYSTKEEKVALVQELRAAKRELIGDRDLTQP